MIYVYFGLVLIIYLTLFVRKMRKRGNENSPNIYFTGFAIIAIMPFWIILLFKSLTFTFDTYLDALNPIEDKQTIIIENDSEVATKYHILQREIGKENWFNAYELDRINFQPYYKVEALAIDTIYFRSDSNHSDRIYIAKIENSLKKSDSLAIAKTFNHSQYPIKVYSNSFQSGSKQPEINTKFEIEYLVMYLIALIGIIYHYLVIRGGGAIRRILALIINTTLLAAVGYMAYNFSTVLYHYHL